MPSSSREGKYIIDLQPPQIGAKLHLPEETRISCQKIWQGQWSGILRTVICLSFYNSHSSHGEGTLQSPKLDNAEKAC